MRWTWLTSLATSVQIDFAEHGGRHYAVMVDQISGFLQIFRCRNKSSSEVILKLSEWGACGECQYLVSRTVARLLRGGKQAWGEGGTQLGL